MNNNKSNIKVKAGVLCIVWLLLAVLFSGFVLGGTVTNTDVSTTTTDSDMVINYQDGTIKFLSQFMVNGTTPRRINDSYDNVDTLIRNSNGRYWAATGANIQTAIDDLNTTVGAEVGGDVWLPKGKYTTTETLYIYYNISLHASWSEILPDDDFDVIRMYPRSTFESAIINISGVAFSDTNACIKFYNPDGFDSNLEGFDLPRNRLVRDVSLVSASQNGIGILLYPRDIGGSGNDMAWNHVKNVKGFNLNCTVKLVVDDAQNYVNFNEFDTIYGVGCNYHIWLMCTASEISGNTFNNIKYEAEAIGNEHYPIYMVGNCDNNVFTNYQVMDWIAQGDTEEWIYLGGYGTADPGGNYFQGASVFWTRQGSSQRFVYEQGFHEHGFTTNNTYVGTYMQRVRNMTVSTTQASNHGINPGWNSNTGIPFYKDTTENPWTYFYGDVTGNDKYGAFQIDVAGNWDFMTESGHITIDPSAGSNVGINNTNPAYELDVTGAIHCTGKLTSDGGNDPPYVLFNKENKLDIIERLFREVPQDEDNKWDGQAIYYDGDEDNMFLLNPKTGERREFVWKSDYDELEQRISDIEDFIGMDKI